MLQRQNNNLYLDFEFNAITDKFVNLVCCVTWDEKAKDLRKWWLHKNQTNQGPLAKYLSNFKTIIAYSAVAECRSFLSLRMDVMAFQWIDLFLEYRMLTNHNHELQYGKQLVEGRVKMTFPPKPKWERTEEDSATGFKPTHSLAEATYKLTGKIRNTKHKDEMRDLIISAPKTFSRKEAKDIVEYCAEDVIFLPKIWERIKEEFRRLAPNANLEEYISEAKGRGKFSALTAEMENNGYPINYEATKNFSNQVGLIMYDLQKEINGLFPEIKPFRWNKPEQRFSWNQKATKEWVADNHNLFTWKKTDSKDVSLALDAFTQHYDYKHDYPTDNFGAQIVRFLKTRQALYGFSSNENSEKRTFWDSVGPDKMVRPYTNHFGAQSSRSQPAATGFMFLKPAWMRSLVEPPRGQFIAGIDYGSEEFLLSALDAEDMDMVNAYLSGDPYLATGKLAGAIPHDATKESHKALRDLFKSTVLGISYLMSKYGLKNKLTADTGEPWTEDEAQEQIDLFYDAYWRLKDRQDAVLAYYETDGFLKLPDGWYMWGDNNNFRSVSNMPIQGLGAVVMRRAALLARERGIKLVLTLHDALYMIDDIGKEDKIAVLRDCMREAFVSVFDKKLHKYAKKIRLDPFAWSPNYKPDSEMRVGKHKWLVPTSNLYVDERSMADYKKFSQYFKPQVWEQL